MPPQPFALQAIHLRFSLRTFARSSDLLHALFWENALPDVIIPDINMPEQNGLSCLKEIRNNLFLSEIPVIIYSTSSLSKDVEYSFLHGASLYLKKTHSQEELEKRFEQIFEIDKSQLLFPSRENFFLGSPSDIRS
jgi:CheY-like chemotaxis protein